MGLSRTLRRAARSALDLVAPPLCLACGVGDAAGDGLCGRCDALVLACGPDPCPVCAAPLGPGAPAEACAACRAHAPRFHAARAAARYTGLAGELVRRAKYGKDPVLARPLATRLVATVVGWEPALRVEEVVCVPTTARRRRERGLHLAEALAEPVAHALRVPFRPARLVRIGEPPPQAALPRSERRRAAVGTVAVRRAPPWTRLQHRPPSRRRGTILLVDDVLTTGSTADACARALLDAGAARVLVAVATRA